MKKLPIGIQTFAELITEDYGYVDKTQNIYNLVSTGKYYFISRPRRFGKSLLVSTLAALFSGKKELFDGLAISTLPYPWKQHPVISISFSDIPHSTPELLEQGIKNYLIAIAQQYSIQLPSHTTGEMLRSLVIKLSHKEKVVLLIDEYDYPILQHIHNIPVAEQMREVLKNFYGVIKGLDPYLKFVLLTGVSQFSKTSIFSGLNNLEDISLSKEYNTLLGYTRHEIATNLSQHLIYNASKMDYSVEQLLDEITIWYDGYKFTKEADATKIYNPFSVLLCLKQHEFSNYWFETGTPTFLIHLIKNQYPDLEEISVAQLKPEHLETFELSNIPLIPLLFQAGYLTISDYDHKKNRITLDYPNYEVRESFTEYIVASLAEATPVTIGTISGRLIDALNECNMQNFCDILLSLFARIPHTLRIKRESYYHSLFHFLMNLLILETRSEVVTNIGILDTVIILDNYIYVFELKINRKPEEALQQIIDRKYYESFTLYNKPIILVGLSFIIKKEDFYIEYIVQNA